MTVLAISLASAFFCALLASITLVVRTTVEAAKISRGEAGEVPFFLAFLVSISWTVFFVFLML